MEFGSTELISHNEALINKVKLHFSFNNMMRMMNETNYNLKDVTNISNIVARSCKSVFKPLALL